MTSLAPPISGPSIGRLVFKLRHGPDLSGLHQAATVMNADVPVPLTPWGVYSKSDSSSTLDCRPRPPSGHPSPFTGGPRLPALLLRVRVPGPPAPGLRPPRSCASSTFRGTWTATRQPFRRRTLAQPATVPPGGPNIRVITLELRILSSSLGLSATDFFYPVAR